MQPRNIDDLIPASALRIGDLSVSEVLDAMRATPGCHTIQRREVINRILNKRDADAVVTMEARTLVRSPEPEGTIVSFTKENHVKVEGVLGRMLTFPQDKIVLEVDEQPHIVAGNTWVDVWSKEDEEDVEPVLCDPKLTSTRPDFVEYQAEFLWMNREWMPEGGRNIEFQDGFVQVHGKATDAYLVSTGVHSPEKVFLVVDGKIHILDRSFKVRVSEPLSGLPCSGTWTKEWDRSSPYYKCEMIQGHAGRCGRRN